MNIGKANSTVVQQLNQPIGESRAGKTIESSGQFSPDDHTQISNLSSYLAAALSSSPAHLLKLDTLATAISSGLITWTQA